MKTIEEEAKEFSNRCTYGVWRDDAELAFIAGAKFMQKQYEEKLRWIDINEELPQECTFVLTKYKNTYAVSWFQDGEFATPYNPTHWRPIELK